VLSHFHPNHTGFRRIAKIKFR